MINKGSENYILTPEEYEKIKNDSPYKIGDLMFTHPSYGESLKCEILDVSYFSRNEILPFQYEVLYENGKKEWIKGHALVKDRNDNPETPDTFISRLI